MSYHVDSLIHPPSFLPCNGRDPEPSQPPPGGPHWLHWPSDKAKRHTDELQTLWCSIGLGTKDETVPEVFFLKANVRPAVFRRQFWNITSQEKSLGFLRTRRSHSGSFKHDNITQTTHDYPAEAQCRKASRFPEWWAFNFGRLTDIL